MKKFEKFVEKFNYLFTFPMVILFLFVSWYNNRRVGADRDSVDWKE
jgi:hypothetical protein